MKDEYGREIPEEPKGLVDDDDKPLQRILDNNGEAGYGKASAFYFSRFGNKQRPRFAKR